MLGRLEWTPCPSMPSCGMGRIGSALPCHHPELCRVRHVLSHVTIRSCAEYDMCSPMSPSGVVQSTACALACHHPELCSLPGEPCELVAHGLGLHAPRGPSPTVHAGPGCWLPGTGCRGATTHDGRAGGCEPTPSTGPWAGRGPPYAALPSRAQEASQPGGHSRAWQHEKGMAAREGHGSTRRVTVLDLPRSPFSSFPPHDDCTNVAPLCITL